MSSNLKVNTILPSTGTSIGIGTAGGDTAISGAASVDTNLTLGGDIIHSGDDTKIRFPSNDLITFETAGAEKVRITSDGVLKITGQTSTIETAGITHHTNNNLYIRGGTTGAVLQSVDGNESWIVQNDYVSASTSGSERLRIDSSGRLKVGDNTRPASDANEGAQLRVTGAPLTRNQYYSPAGHYYGSFGYTDNTYTKSWIAVDSSYAQSSAVSAGIFLSAFHQDANSSDCGYTIKNLRDGNALVFSRVKTASSVSNPAVEEERVRITSGGSVNIGGNYTQTGYILSTRGGAVDQTVQFSNTRSTNGNIHYFGITLTNAGYGQALFGHTGHTTQSEQAAWIGLAGDDVAGGVGVKCFRGGNVIKKGTCAFQAYNGSGQINQSSYVIFTTAAFNIGGNYNTGNGIFTAPITGRYLFTLTGLYNKNTSSATFKLAWHVNNTNSGVASEWQTSNLNGSYNTIGNSSIIFQLSANDTVRLYVEGAGAYHISGIQTRLCGYLLG